MKSTIGALIVMVCLGASAQAMAGDVQLYGFAGAGQARLKQGEAAPFGSAVDKKEFAWNAGLGLQLNSHLALEAGYYDMGKYATKQVVEHMSAAPQFGYTTAFDQTDQADGRVRGVGISAKLGATVGGFFPYVRLGTFLDNSSYNRVVTNQFDGQVNVGQKSSLTPRTLWGAGVGYKYVTLDFLQVRDVGLWQKTQVNQVTLGLQVPFGR